jgi:hypothetical protein
VEDPGVSVWALPELVEAAARVGDTELARDALERLDETTQPSGTDVAHGIEARSRALLTNGDNADLLYREAIERVGRTQVRPELGRATANGCAARVDASTRASSCAPPTTCSPRSGWRRSPSAPAGNWSLPGSRSASAAPRRARSSQPRKPRLPGSPGDGLSKPEIGAQLFISARTVEWHLRKVLTKLDISSRRQLRVALPEGGRALAP